MFALVARSARTAARLPTQRASWSSAPRSTRALSAAPAGAPLPPLGAAAIRALDTAGVTAFVVGLGVDANNSKGLRAQNVDGPALLEATVDELCDRYGMLGGDAHRVMRAVQRAVAEAAAEAALAMAKASAEAALAMAKASAEAALAMAEAERRAAVTLTVYPPCGGAGPTTPCR